MEKKELIIKEFLDNLKKTLNITSLYTKEHPSFLKAVEDFKKNVEDTISFIDCIRISVAVDHLLFDQIKYSEPVHAELAKKMHLHKIKRIEIRRGITFEELTLLLNTISMPIKDFIKSGSIANIGTKTAHVWIEEIDYYELLRSEGAQNYKDIWVYLLTEALNLKDYEKIIQLAGSFGEMLKHFTPQEILENSELYENIKTFLAYLKDKDKEKFSQCSRDIAGYMFNITSFFSDAELEKLRVLFGIFSEGDLAGILLDEILSQDDSDSFSFDLFLGVIDGERHQIIAPLTVNLLREKIFGDRRKIHRKVEKLISASEKYQFSAVYHNAFDPFLKDISSGKIISFDRDSAYANYRIILLNLLSQEKDKSMLDVITREISKELKAMIQKMDLAYVKLLTNILKKKKFEGLRTDPVFEVIDKQITDFVENNIWNEQLPEDFRPIADYPESSVLGIDTYLKRIFDENNFNPGVLRLFFKFFPDRLHLFYKNMESKYSDIKFNDELIKNLKKLNIGAVLEILKQIYHASNSYIKKEVLTAMQELDIFDKEFLLSILRKEDVFLKEEALLILAKDENSKKEALHALFSIESPWGIRNGLLLNNIILVEDAGVKDAKEYLTAISKKRFFWNWKIKSKAKEVLNRWGL